MNVDIWGSNCWNFTHILLFNATENPNIEERLRYKNFFTILGELLPCSYCRISYSKFMKELPIELYWDTRAGLIYWWYLFHNKVNEKLNKSKPSFKSIVKIYELSRARCKTEDVEFKQNKGNFGKCLNPITNSINEEELDLFVKNTLKKYNNINNNIYINNNININNNNIIILLVLIIIIYIYYKKK
jgi:hypothetical protein